MKPLATFIAEFTALLEGQKSAREVEAVLGPSPSGTARLALYATLVKRQQRGVLDEFYAAVKVADASSSTPRFSSWRDGFLSLHRPRHWAPARAAESFGKYLEAQGAEVALVELADFAWTRHAVLHAPAADDASALAVCHFTHAVQEFTTRVEREGLARGKPQATPQTLLLGRSRHHSRLVTITPSVAALVALQVLEEGGWSPELPEVPRADVVSEADALLRAGLLSEKAVAAVAKGAG